MRAGETAKSQLGGAGFCICLSCLGWCRECIPETWSLTNTAWFLNVSQLRGQASTAMMPLTILWVELGPFWTCHLWPQNCQWLGPGWIRCANLTGAGAIDYIGSRPRKAVLDLLGARQSLEAPPAAWSLALQNALATQTAMLWEKTRGPWDKLNRLGMSKMGKR